MAQGDAPSRGLASCFTEPPANESPARLHLIGFCALPRHRLAGRCSILDQRASSSCPSMLVYCIAIRWLSVASAIACTGAVQHAARSQQLQQDVPSAANSVSADTLRAAIQGQCHSTVDSHSGVPCSDGMGETRVNELSLLQAGAAAHRRTGSSIGGEPGSASAAAPPAADGAVDAPDADLAVSVDVTVEPARAASAVRQPASIENAVSRTTAGGENLLGPMMRAIREAVPRRFGGVSRSAAQQGQQQQPHSLQQHSQSQQHSQQQQQQQQQQHRSSIEHSSGDVALAAAAEGDVVQGLTFTLICLIIVIGIYLLVFNEYRPGETAVPMGLDRADGARSSGWRWSSGQPAASSLLPPRTSWQTPAAASKLHSSKSLGGQTLRAADTRMGGMPGTPPTALGTQDRLAGSIIGGSRGAADSWHTELPQIYPQLVMPIAHTRLAVPLAMLSQPNFEVDVLGLSGVALLSAVLQDRNGTRSIEISLNEVGTKLAVVTSDMEIFGADGTFFGALARDSGPQLSVADGPQLVLRDRQGRPILLLVSTRRDASGCDFKMRSISAGRIVERATAVRRPAGRLPGEHYEVVANPNVDAVLVLAVLLAAVVFEFPSVTLGAPASGRPSMVGLGPDPFLG
mmetsp:Transcript_93140/g.299830  ORF Transcript_93140/g.299830 Transcript_93140/m.299830 type:complete len:629 (-) Transcript_93140:181-2067(-)